MMNGSRNEQNLPLIKGAADHNFYGDEVQVSAVQISFIDDACNKSSQEDFSKDLIDLGNDSMLVKVAKLDSNRKEISLDRSPF